MDPVVAGEMTAILAMFSALLGKLGPSGLLGLILGAPLLLALVFSGQSIFHVRHITRFWEAHRAETDRLREEHRRETAALIEGNRREIAAVLKTLGEDTAKVTRYYEDNVNLVINYQTMAKELQTLIVSTIQSLGKMEAHFETLCRTIKKEP